MYVYIYDAELSINLALIHFLPMFAAAKLSCSMMDFSLGHGEASRTIDDDKVNYSYA
jgi:hypothetical protein